MNRPATLFRGASIGFALFVALFVRGDELPLPFEFRHVHHGEMRLNLQSQAGVPISITPDDPPGSNGGEPRDNESVGSTSTAATVRQMQSLMSPGGVVPNRTNVAYIHQGTEEPTLILRRAVIGMPYYSKQSAVAFGDIIAPPITDENGIPLPIGSVYWQGEPYSWYGHEAAGASSTNGYYWSPHARLVYAHQTGRVRITWIASQPYTAANKPDWTNNLWDKGVTADADGHYLKRGRNYYKLYTVQYQVAGYPAKPTRKIYWTEKGFFAGSVPIRVPEGAVGKVNFLYNKQVPEFVEQEFKDIGESNPADGNKDSDGQELSKLKVMRTVWWDSVQKVLLAYNREGRVLMEVLGDAKADGKTYVSLGTEIVDVFRQASPNDVPVELGDRILPPPGASGSDLIPRPVQQAATSGFYFAHQQDGPDRPALYYAAAETRNQNDLRIFWMETGAGGLEWPAILGRYTCRWPKDAAKYSHYLRPRAASFEESARTAVYLDALTAPQILFQDPLDQPRARLENGNRFHTFLDAEHPAHRTLLLNSKSGRIAFERVFSWLADSVENNALLSLSVGTNLVQWRRDTKSLNWADGMTQRPDSTNMTVHVGKRIEAPSGLGLGESGAAYVAGHIRHEPNVLLPIVPEAYRDPMEVGFAAASTGAIIPVNVYPTDRLEVWWFRPGSGNAGTNAGNSVLGFSPVLWPAVIARYTMTWPDNARTIVLSGNQGAPDMSPTEQKGVIYYQNDRTKAGYNPNEEHAVMVGGKAYAIRNDLNRTDRNSDTYSSDPFVLVSYTADDGRPAMATFEIERGVFSAERNVIAGQILQPPAPLHLFPPALDEGGESMNQQDLTLTDPVPNGYSGGNQPAHYEKYTWSDKKGQIWVYRGRHDRTSAFGSPTFRFKYYYKTQVGFAWPGYEGPAPGSIVPYMRENALDDPTKPDTKPLLITYRPRWPDELGEAAPLPVLPIGATLLNPVGGLPGVRQFSTAAVLYDQGRAYSTDPKARSVVLHDPTRVKTSIPERGLPKGVESSLYQGKHYFPKLPPHLVERVYFDPNQGMTGALCLIGQYREEAVGNDYLLLNVLDANDLQTVRSISSDPAWTTLVDGLRTSMKEPRAAEGITYGVGSVAEVLDDSVPVDSYALTATGSTILNTGYVTLVENNGASAVEAGLPVALHIFKVGERLNRGESKIVLSSNPLAEVVTVQHSGDFGGAAGDYEFQWWMGPPVGGLPPRLPEGSDEGYQEIAKGVGLNRYEIKGGDIRALGDQYIMMRYRPIRAGTPLYAAPAGAVVEADSSWSEWTEPVLVEGWIKRVLAGINPFSQRLKDLFNNRVNTDVSLLTQAGRRWEGDVPLNLDAVSGMGLIEIYETVLRRGRAMSIEAGHNNPGANKALLLAAGYLSDLYMLVGNEAWADAANPTIGIGTADRQYGNIATALFSFKGQVRTLLEEELALLRGRDDFVVPGVETRPVYNRLVWNYTRGIDSGEVIYALNYNIQEKPDSTPDGLIDAADAARMFPQGQGDAYGHYLTATKGYFSLLLNTNFDWVPEPEAVNVLGKAVLVDYTDERKFAAAAAALGRAGNQVFDLTWRRDYQAVHAAGWSAFRASRENANRRFRFLDASLTPPASSTKSVTRYWSLDHWASRAGQGMFVNWLVGNALLPAVDSDPTHEGIQRVDRTTVPELLELSTLAQSLQGAMEDAENGSTPLGVPEDGLAFDLDPNAVVGQPEGAHFEQVYRRASLALMNAVAAFDDAKHVTGLMRSEQDSLTELQDGIYRQEQAYTNALIEIYGTPYPEDIGPGGTYKQGYEGPDFLHYAYVERPEFGFPDLDGYSGASNFRIVLKDLPADWGDRTDFFTADLRFPSRDEVGVGNGIGWTKEGELALEFEVGEDGIPRKPDGFQGRRRTPGRIQGAISSILSARERLRHAAHSAADTFGDIETAIKNWNAEQADLNEIRSATKDISQRNHASRATRFSVDSALATAALIIKGVVLYQYAGKEALPTSFIAGLANGGDLTSAARAASETISTTQVLVHDGIRLGTEVATQAAEMALEFANDDKELDFIQPLERRIEQRNQVQDLLNQYGDAQDLLWTLNERVRELDDASRELQRLVAEGDRIQAEREVFRRRSAALVQGYRTRDAAFRLFRNEKLERYKTLFDLAARYALLAANAYDYDTGLLGSSAGRTFVGRIIGARALGVVGANGEPQFAGSQTGDPGLSSALAEMRADWEVLRGRLGFNNPDSYNTTASLRAELLRILPGTEGNTNWKDVLAKARRANLLDDPDLRRLCMQLDNGDGLPVPGLVFSFGTTIADGYNLFGQPLAAGDHSFSPSSFATKIFAVGVALEGYKGMARPAANAGAVGGSSAVEPSAPFLDPVALSATPYVYLVPVGMDSMRSPPLGDSSEVRTWSVQDLAIPMPFNIGRSAASSGPRFVSNDSLTEPIFGLRKHQAFRAVDRGEYFDSEVIWASSLMRREYNNSRLIGRSVWNSQWKLVIPGRTLLHDADEGLDRLIKTLADIKLNFITYSYSGN